jgi:DNA polymerase III epsilon subunit-like protein
VPDNLDRFVALDVEIASRSPLTICAIGIARFESGGEAAHYQSLVRVRGRVRYTDIHGLTAADLRDAPRWPVVWKRVLDVLDGNRIVVGYRAAFDRAAVMAMCARDAVRLPPLRFVCAAKAYEQHAGRSADLVSALRALHIPFPGKPHDPMADARAAAAIMLAIRPQGVRERAIQLSKSPGAADPATPH